MNTKPLTAMWTCSLTVETKLGDGSHRMFIEEISIRDKEVEVELENIRRKGGKACGTCGIRIEEVAIVGIADAVAIWSMLRSTEYIVLDTEYKSWSAFLLCHSLLAIPDEFTQPHCASR